MVSSANPEQLQDAFYGLVGTRKRELQGSSKPWPKGLWGGLTRGAHEPGSKSSGPGLIMGEVAQKTAAAFSGAPEAKNWSTGKDYLPWEGAEV